jgi:uncharacterized membrane protein YhaH (DUF805 family)
VIGALLVGVYFWALTERVSSRIRNSQYWFVGWFAMLMVLATGFQLMTPVLNGLPIDDDIAVPLIFGVLLLVTFSMYFIQRRRLRRNHG